MGDSPLRGTLAQLAPIGAGRPWQTSTPRMRVLAADLFRDEPFANADQRPPLTDGAGWDHHAVEFADGGEAGELEGVVAVGLTLDTLPLPRGPGRARHER